MFFFGRSIDQADHDALLSIDDLSVGRCIGCTPPNTVPRCFPVSKRTQKNCHFRVFIMIRISQTHVFLKDYVHIHQMGNHFVSVYRLNFSPTEQETKTSILPLFSPQ